MIISQTFLFTMLKLIYSFGRKVVKVVPKAREQEISNLISKGKTDLEIINELSK
jgi:hypothetical protein